LEDLQVDAVIHVEGLRKIYGDKTEALKGITFEVREGEFFGFLGPNGAGKSTTIKILITLLEKTSGIASVLGFDSSRHPDEIRRRIGYAAQETGIDDDLTGRENLELQGRLYHLPKAKLRERVDELLDLMDLTQDANRSAGSYSGGMRKRLDLATGLIHSPRVLFLDEPTTGLDPQNRAALWKYLERLNREEKLTIFLTTHYMEEADRLCHRLAIIDHGHIMTEGAPADLKQQLGGDVISLTFRENGVPLDKQLAAASTRLQNLELVSGVNSWDHGLNVIVREGGAAVPLVLRDLEGDGISVDRLSLTSPSLDDVFLKYTGHSIRQEELDTKWRGNQGMWASRRRPR
jgi:ABC-2 type transport system ATP-binding protein